MLRFTENARKPSGGSLFNQKLASASHSLLQERNLIPLPKSGVPLPPEQDKARYTKEVSFSRNLKKQEDDEEVTDPTAQSSQQQQQTSELPSQTPQRVSFPLSRLPK
ncbi:Uncharacterized protein Rs2_03507 [Raphanus sativus]|nr:Uncharacterized protein Rs2_03507 [Raphanus sativus]